MPSHFHSLNIMHLLGVNLTKQRERGIGGLITLIIMCGCDLLNCKVHLNPSANYGMFCGGVSGGEVVMHKTQSLALIKCQICDQRNCLDLVIHRIN